MKYLAFNFKLLIFFWLANIPLSTAQEKKIEINPDGDFYFNKGISTYNTNLDSSIFYFTLAKDLLKVEEKWEPFINCYNALASLHYSKRNFEKYEHYATQAVQKSKLLLGDQNPIYSVALNNLDALYTEKGNYGKSIYYLKKSLKIKEENNLSKVEIAETLQNLSSSYSLEGDGQNALKYANKALEYYRLSKEPNPLKQASALSTIGYTYKYLNELDSALIYYLQSLEILEREDVLKTTSWQKKIISAYQQTAKIFIQKQELQIAQQYLSKALILQQDDNTSRKSLSLQILAQIYTLQKKYVEAEKAIKNSISLMMTYNKKANTFIATKETYLGDIYFLQHDFLQALEQYQSAIDKLSGYANPDSLNAESFLSKQQALTSLHKKAETLYQLYLETKDINNLSQSFDTYLLATQLIRYMRIGFQTPEAKNFLAESTTPIYETSIRLALELYKTTGDKKYLVEAFQIAESNKALLLLESLNEHSAKGIAGIPDSVLTRERDLRIDIAFYQKKIIEENQKQVDKNNTSIKLWEDQVFSIEQQLDRLTTQTEKDHPKYFEIKHKNDPIAINMIQQNLKGTQKAFLEYFVGEKNIYLFILTADRLDIKQIENESLIQQQVDSLRSIINTPPDNSFGIEDYNQLTGITHELFKKLISPALIILSSNITDLIIIPDYYLNYIPFDILLKNNKSENGSLSPKALDYLFEDYNISYDYSATLHLKNKNRKQRYFEKGFIGFAPAFKNIKEVATRTCSEDGLYALQCSEQEVMEIAALTNGIPLAGIDANRASFESEVQGYKIIHLATHACIDEQNSNLNKIFLTDDYLSDLDLYNMELNAELAVLSACNTGSGKLIKGEGVMSLARGFINAGCSSTLISMWSVDDCATSEIMVYFYESLKAGLPKDQAIKQAKLKYLDSVDKSKMHPYYWAAFVPFGDMEAMEIGQQSNWLFYLIPILFLMFIFFLFKKKKTSL